MCGGGSRRARHLCREVLGSIFLVVVRSLPSVDFGVFKPRLEELLMKEVKTWLVVSAMLAQRRRCWMNACSRVAG